MKRTIGRVVGVALYIFVLLVIVGMLIKITFMVPWELWVAMTLATMLVKLWRRIRQ